MEPWTDEEWEGWARLAELLSLLAAFMLAGGPEPPPAPAPDAPAGMRRRLAAFAGRTWDALGDVLCAAAVLALAAGLGLTLGLLGILDRLRGPEAPQ